MFQPFTKEEESLAESEFLFFPPPPPPSHEAIYWRQRELSASGVQTEKSGNYGTADDTGRQKCQCEGQKENQELLTKKSQVKDNVCLIPLIELSWSQLVALERFRRPPTGRSLHSST